MRRFVYAAAVVVAIDAAAACTPTQLHDFIAWHQQDPAAATAFSRLPAIQSLLHDPVPTQAAPPSRPSHTRDGGVWDRIAWCESGGQWHHSPVHNRYGSFSGG